MIKFLHIHYQLLMKNYNFFPNFHSQFKKLLYLCNRVTKVVFCYYLVFGKFDTPYIYTSNVMLAFWRANEFVNVGRRIPPKRIM